MPTKARAPVANSAAATSFADHADWLTIRIKRNRAAATGFCAQAPFCAVASDKSAHEIIRRVAQDFRRGVMLGDDSPGLQNNYLVSQAKCFLNVMGDK